MKKTKHQYRNLINRTFSLVRELWMKGYPIIIGELSFKTAKKQILYIRKSNKKRRKPYYSITFDKSAIEVSKKSRYHDKVKVYYLNNRQIEALKATVIRNQPIEHKSKNKNENC